MYLPFDYIFFKLMLILKYDDRETKISKKNLYQIIIKLFDLLVLSADELEELQQNFHFPFELSELINIYHDYLTEEESYIVLNDIDLYSLEELVHDLEENYPEKLIYNISSVIESNYIFIELLGIKINKKLYNYLLEIERKIEKMYDEFSYRKNIPSFIHELKVLLFKRRLLNSFTSNNLDYSDYYNLYLYSENVAFNSWEETFLSFNIPNKSFEDNILSNPFLNAIFLKEELSLHNIHARMEKDITLKYEDQEDVVKTFSQANFYLTFLKFLEEEIATVTSRQLCYELKICKYRLMNVLDSVYGTLTIIGDNSFKAFSKEDYSFIKPDITFFIEELLTYSDKSYQKKSHVPNIDNYYFNTIKKLLIKTYYHLTQSKDVENQILSNSLYGVNKISTSFLDDAIGYLGKEKKKKIVLGKIKNENI